MKNPKLISEKQYRRQLESICNISYALATTKDLGSFLELILQEAMSLTNCDGGTIYRYQNSNKSLSFDIFINCSLGIHKGGTSGNPINLPQINLFKDDGSKNINNVAAYCALNKNPINIADAYNMDGFDFSGMREFDKINQYHSQSFLTAPLLDLEGKILGVLQLINKISPEQQKIAFDDIDELIVKTLSAQSSVAIMRMLLLQAKH